MRLLLALAVVPVAARTRTQSTPERYGASAFVAHGGTDAGNLDAYLGAPQSNNSGPPTAADLQADRTFVDRFYRVAASRTPERLSNLTLERATEFIRSGRPFAKGARERGCSGWLHITLSPRVTGAPPPHPQ